MGRGQRIQPRKLKTKLRRIRSVLELTQKQMAEHLKSYAPDVSIHPGHISQFESGQREPQLLVLLAYAKLAKISTDVLIDDDLDLSSFVSSSQIIITKSQIKI